ncbi:pleckstrin homology domain-containing family J member 1-like [Amphiura filiformis]|uniref:pleckstrin homology domain-containing family J member 1-like n=1 Tax=Amphiura filiformis TaxID=82378 RepID=UPI003B21486D
MRFNEHELYFLAIKCKPDLEAKFWHRPPQGMIRQEGYRERLVRLKCNFLFYIRTNEFGHCLEPLGALCLERCIIQQEPRSDKGYVFSICYPGETDRKHYLACSTAQQCEHWMSMLKCSNYERLTTTLNILQTKLARVRKGPAGRSPLLKRRSELLQEDGHKTSQQQQNQQFLQPNPPVQTNPEPSGPAEGVLIDFS